MRAIFLILTMAIGAAPLRADRLLEPLQPRGIVAPPVDYSSRQWFLNIVPEKLVLDSSEVLLGKFMGVDPKQGIRWKHPAIAKPVFVDLKKVSEVSIHRERLPGDARVHSGRVVLADGSSLSGEVVSLADGKLVLDTWCAGRLTIPQKGIQSIAPGRDRGMIYAGPTGKSGWVITGDEAVALPHGGGGALPEEILKRIYAQNQRLRAKAVAPWSVRGGSLVCANRSGLIGRNLEYAPRTQIELNVDWTSAPNLWVIVGTDNLRSHLHGNGYSMRITQAQTMLYRHEVAGGQARTTRIGNASKTGLKKGTNRIALAIDRAAGTIAFYVNGERRMEWKDADGFAGKGKGLVFANQSAHPMEISKIRATKWDGREPGTAKKPLPLDKEDLAHLVNDDTLRGKLLRIAEGKAHFKSALGNLAVPLERVSLIRLANPGFESFPKVPLTMGVIFQDGGSIIFNLLSWEGNAVRAQSPLLGKIELRAEKIILKPLPPKIIRAKPNPPPPSPNLPRDER